MINPQMMAALLAAYGPQPASLAASPTTSGPPIGAPNLAGLVQAAQAARPQGGMFAPMMKPPMQPNQNGGNSGGSGMGGLSALLPLLMGSGDSGGLLSGGMFTGNMESGGLTGLGGAGGMTYLGPNMPVGTGAFGY